MPSAVEYARHIAPGATDVASAAWLAAAVRAAELSHRRWTYVGHGTSAGQEILVSTLALVIYAVAVEDGQAPQDVSLSRVVEWFDAGPGQPRIEAALRGAGHVLPVPASRSALPYPVNLDPVGAVWWNLTAWTDFGPYPSDERFDGTDGWTGPDLGVGLVDVAGLLAELTG